MSETIIICPSNTRIEGNTTSNFKINLSSPIELDSEYEYKVGLMEMSYTNDLCTFKNDFYIIENTIEFFASQDLRFTDEVLEFNKIVDAMKEHFNDINYDNLENVEFEINIDRALYKKSLKFNDYIPVNIQLKMEPTWDMYESILQNYAIQYKSVKRRFKIHIKDGYLNSTLDIIEELNKKGKYKFWKIYQDNKIAFSFPNPDYSHKNDIRLTFSTNLNQVLGFKDSEMSFKPRDIVHANHTPHFTRGNDFIYIYCNICTHLAVGDTEAPLLRIIPHGGYNSQYSLGSVISANFSQIMYIPIAASNYINSIHFEIRTDTGDYLMNDSKMILILSIIKEKKINLIKQDGSQI